MCEVGVFTARQKRENSNSIQKIKKCIQLTLWRFRVTRNRLVRFNFNCTREMTSCQSFCTRCHLLQLHINWTVSDCNHCIMCHLSHFNPLKVKKNRFSLRRSFAFYLISFMFPALENFCARTIFCSLQQNFRLPFSQLIRVIHFFDHKWNSNAFFSLHLKFNATIYSEMNKFSCH